MGNSSKVTNFHAGGFLYNPETHSVLLQKRDLKASTNPGKWAFFGGSNEEGETPTECFEREFREELGIEVKKESLVPLCDYFNGQYGKWRYIFYVKSNLKKSQMKLGEGADFDWIPLDKVFNYDLTEKTKRDLETFAEIFKEKNSHGFEISKS